LRYKIREFMQKEVAPIVVPYWEKAEFPFPLIEKLKTLNLAGLDIKGNGAPVRLPLGDFEFEVLW
jgi:hypothetical protein